MKTATIELPIYTDEDGNPVCTNGINSCKLLIEYEYDFNLCKATNTRIDDVYCGVKNAIVWNGYRPHEKCPLWNKKS